MELPNRFHIGTPKAGSTYLYDLLRSHPQVSLSSHQKLNFYSKRFERGADWYLSSFVGEGVRVDASPKIFMQGKVAAQRIQAWVEEPRFLLILRNPIDYVHSHYQMQLRGGYFKRSPNYARVPNRLVEFVELYPDYLERGLYHRTLSTEWLSRFELSRFKIVLFEDLVSRTESTLKEICEFYGIDDVPLQTVSSSKNTMLRYPFIYTLQKRVARHPRLRSAVKRSALANYVHRTLLAAKAPELSSAERRCLREQFSGDVAALAALLGRSLAEWKDFEDVARARQIS